MLFLARRYEEAVRDRAERARYGLTFWLARWVLGMAYEQLGDRPRAAAALQHADDFSGGNLMVRVCWVESACSIRVSTPAFVRIERTMRKRSLREVDRVVAGALDILNPALL